ncbi:MAG: glycosyl transferase family 2 [Confluentimicrobium sp.]|nr:glycosyl transferase family 2 [Actibacterium sp.]
MYNVTRVTVIIPAYNARATLGRTLQSVFDQTHRNLEIFVVDDGSTDSTPLLAERAACRDKRVIVLRQQNAGVAAARNLALARASGEYTAWLDADDLWHPTKIEKQLAVFANAPEPPSFVYTGYRLIDTDDRILPNFRTLTDVSGHTLCRQIATNFFSNVSSIMIPTELARRFGGHDPRLRGWGIEGAEDLLLQLQLSTIGPAGCCPEALVGYRMHPHNMSRGHKRAARSNLRALDLIEEMDPDVPGWVFRLGRARTVGYVLHMLHGGDVAGARALLWCVLKRQPLYTLLTLVLIARWKLCAALGIGPQRDPEVGADFLQADPARAPWHGHMLLTSWHRRRLDAADAARREAIPQPATGTRSRRQKGI